MNFLIIITLLAGQVVSSNWVQVANSGNTTTYLDYSTIKQTGPNSRTAWVRRQYAVPDAKGVSYSVAKIAYDCVNETSGLTAITSYTAAGAVLDFADYKSYEVNMSAQVPGSVGLKTLTTVCQLTP